MEVQPKTILLSTRNPDYLFNAEGNLEQAGYRIISCLTEDDTLLHIKRSKFDALLVTPDIGPASLEKSLDLMEVSQPNAILIEEEGQPEKVLETVTKWLPLN